MRKLIIVMAAALTLASCQTARQDRALTGGVIGGATGAVIGGVAGKSAMMAPAPATIATDTARSTTYAAAEIRSDHTTAPDPVRGGSSAFQPTDVAPASSRSPDGSPPDDAHDALRRNALRDRLISLREGV